MPKKQKEIVVLCPWCGQGMTLADKSADIRVSCACISCGRFYKIDFLTMATSKLKQKPHRAAIKKRQKIPQLNNE